MNFDYSDEQQQLADSLQKYLARTTASSSARPS
jgi:hypothetical protein